jgi:hypothetical protein
MLTTLEIAWLAGLLEGEGCFAMYGNDRPLIKLAMTDLDTISKAAGLMGCSNIQRKEMDNPNHKTQYVFYVYNSLAISWMMTIYSFMSNRRKEKIKEVISKWKLFTPNPQGPPRKIKIEQYQDIIQRKKKGERSEDIAKIFGVARQTVDRIYANTYRPTQ